MVDRTCIANTPKLLDHLKNVLELFHLCHSLGCVNPTHGVVDERKIIQARPETIDEGTSED